MSLSKLIQNRSSQSPSAIQPRAITLSARRTLIRLRGGNERKLTFNQFILQLLPLQFTHDDLSDQITMLDIDTVQTPLQSSNLCRKLWIRFAKIFDFGGMRILLSREILPFFSELILFFVGTSWAKEYRKEKREERGEQEGEKGRTGDEEKDVRASKALS